MPRQRSNSILEPVMKSAENRQAHIARTPRPHLAQEFEDRGGRDHAEAVCLKLLPDARRCAKGEVRPHVKARIQRERRAA